ncbi:MAG: tryptophan-rich sensory protein [Bacteroidia bacterium]|jgi:tryptophan-rich sensory protein
MKKFNRFIQIVWLVVAAVSAWEAFLAYYNAGKFNTRFYAFAFVFVSAIAMYAIRKRQAKSIK